ncbi:dual specificity tyrosine-phosphorylation-regulated kinase 2-like isoform X1 [Artemia franciscana]|uniref:dual-specificity kinase n=1 Tax=Artemia franciscana TaxID=6661 RepID=A0AA88IEG1_ARTSF|nr:hypothetical protein QYM36_007863 [Artemia franciscana]
MSIGYFTQWGGLPAVVNETPSESPLNVVEKPILYSLNPALHHIPVNHIAVDNLVGYPKPFDHNYAFGFGVEPVLALPTPPTTQVTIEEPNFSTGSYQGLFPATHIRPTPELPKIHDPVLQQLTIIFHEQRQAQQGLSAVHNFGGSFMPPSARNSGSVYVPPSARNSGNLYVPPSARNSGNVYVPPSVRTSTGPIIAPQTVMRGESPVLDVRLQNNRSSLTTDVSQSQSAGKRLGGPWRPEKVLKVYKNVLSVFESTEILNFTQVFYIGTSAKKRPGMPTNNFGFDDDQDSYIHVPHDHIAYRYEVIKVIGKGSFGQVVKAYDHKKHIYVALKMVRNQPRFHRQAQEEIKILEHLREHDKENKMNVIHLYDCFMFRNHVCITFELLSINLYELIKKNKFQGFSLQLVRKFAHSLLLCLDGLSKSKIIHCDMKPENVLLKQQGRSGIKVIDFGSSCYENQRVYTYIQSRFYRAPEVILGLRYGLPIDMWSLGCILAELHLGFPLLPGEDEGDQLACMMELLDMPPARLLEGSKRSKLFVNSKGYPRYCTATTSITGQVILNGGISRRGKHRGPPGSKSLAMALKGKTNKSTSSSSEVIIDGESSTDPLSDMSEDETLFMDFINRCLDWDPQTRMTPEEALRHSWLRRRLPRPPSEKSVTESSTPPRIGTYMGVSNSANSSIISNSGEDPNNPDIIIIGGNINGTAVETTGSTSGSMSNIPAAVSKTIIVPASGHSMVTRSFARRALFSDTNGHSVSTDNLVCSGAAKQNRFTLDGSKLPSLGLQS